MTRDDSRERGVKRYNESAAARPENVARGFICCKKPFSQYIEREEGLRDVAVQRERNETRLDNAEDDHSKNHS